jgi:CRISPR/Cas system Type II protein with McrA/HNH and RuvC-like nuclease domain
MAERKQISKKTRFEVLKRDHFTCQYCGRMSPDVILEIDHIKPVAKGGDNSITNLITSCRDCNRGKGKTKLSDNEALKKQQKAIKDLAEKREQMDMMMQWKLELENHLSEETNNIANYIEAISGEHLSDIGKNKVKSLIKRFSYSEVLTAVEISFDTYYEGDRNSWFEAFQKIGGVCYNKRMQTED